MVRQDFGKTGKSNFDTDLGAGFGLSLHVYTYTRSGYRTQSAVLACTNTLCFVRRFEDVVWVVFKEEDLPNLERLAGQCDETVALRAIINQ